MANVLSKAAMAAGLIPDPTCRYSCAACRAMSAEVHENLNIDVAIANAGYTHESRGVVERQQRPPTPYITMASPLWTPYPRQTTLESILEEDIRVSMDQDDDTDDESYKSLGSTWSTTEDEIPRRFRHRDSLSLDRARRLMRPRNAPVSKLQLPRMARKLRRRRFDIAARDDGTNLKTRKETPRSFPRSIGLENCHSGGDDYRPNPMFQCQRRNNISSISLPFSWITGSNSLSSVASATNLEIEAEVERPRSQGPRFLLTPPTPMPPGAANVSSALGQVQDWRYLAVPNENGIWDSNKDREILDGKESECFHSDDPEDILSSRGLEYPYDGSEWGSEVYQTPTYAYCGNGTRSRHYEERRESPVESLQRASILYGTFLKKVASAAAGFLSALRPGSF